MREIKFRAKREHWNMFGGRDEWLYSNGYYFDGINYWFTLPGKDTSALAGAEHRIIDIKTLGEYTGLKDKNSNEIYEGDILGMMNPTVKGGCYEVVWHNFGWQLLLRNFPDIANYYVNCGKHLEDDKVIGNIYENKELLEVRNGK